MDIFVKICYIISAILVTGFCLFLFGCYQTKRLKIKDVIADENSSCLTKICFISDLHFPMMFVNEKLLIERISSQDSDIIMIGGDICHKKNSKSKAFSFLKRLSESVPDKKILIVLGNHDVRDICDCDRIFVDAYKKDLKNLAENIVVLENETYEYSLYGTGNKVKILGLTDKTAKNASSRVENFVKENISDTYDNEKIIVLAHNPDMVLKFEDVVEEARKDVLVLSGHTHGGQVWMPFNFEFNILRHDKLPKRGYKHGFYQYNDYIKLYITCGVGCVALPIRLGTTPEIAFVCF